MIIWPMVRAYARGRKAHMVCRLSQFRDADWDLLYISGRKRWFFTDRFNRVPLPPIKVRGFAEPVKIRVLDEMGKV